MSPDMLIMGFVRAISNRSSHPGLNKIWEKVLSLAQKQEHGKGRYLILNTVPTGTFFYLEKGRLTILHGAVNGKVQHMLYMEPGSLINVADALGRQSTNFRDPGCQFYCLTDVTLWSFPGFLLTDEAFISRNPELIANLLTSLGVKLLAMHNSLSYANAGDALTKICRFCLNMSQANDGATELVPNISQTELANLFGMHRGTLLRSIQELKQRGVIGELTKERLSIENLEELRRLAMR